MVSFIVLDIMSLISFLLVDMVSRYIDSHISTQLSFGAAAAFA